MGFDTLLKRYFALVLLALVGLVAYFQASGVSQFIASRMEVEAKALAASASALPSPTVAATTSPHTTTAQAIIDRNPFDSVTGPLNKVETPEVGEESAEAAIDFSDPYNAPACDDAKLLVVAASDDPAWSVAALSASHTQGKTQMRRIGDEFGTKRVWYIAWDRVWLQGDGQLCQSKMFAEEEPQAAAAPPPKAMTTNPRGNRGAPSVPADIASKIQRVSATEFNVDRSVVDQILENQATLMRSARIVPEQENGKVVGIRLFGVRPDTLLGTLGLENGDRLETINGFNMASPEKALEAYARLRTADHLTVTVNRRGKPTNIDFNIK